MGLTELLDQNPGLNNGMVPYYNDGERTAIPLKKYFHDISCYLSAQKIENLIHLGPGINTMKDKNGLKLYIDNEYLDKLYSIYRTPDGKYIQNNRILPMNKPSKEVYTPAPKERLGVNPIDNNGINDRVNEIERLVIKQGNSIMSKEEIVQLIKDLISEIK